MKVIDCPYQLAEPETVFTGKWLKTRQVRFKCPNGTEGVWQSSHRTTRPDTSEVDGVDIIAVLNKQGKKYFIFVKQFRIPMNGWCLEFPAGLIDQGETVEQAALRELKEETGYTADASSIVHKTRGIQCLDPGLTDDSVQFVTVQIDGDRAENLKPEQKLDSFEQIEVVLVECDSIMEYLRSVEKQLHVEAMLYSFAVGYALSKQLNMNI